MNSSKINIAIISLKNDFEKRNRLIPSLLSVQGIADVNVIEAVNGKELSAIEYFLNNSCSTSKFFGRKYLSPSELGCFLSHKLALEKFIECDSEWLLVLEDDVSIKGDLTSFLKSVDYLDKNGIFILGGQDGLKSFSRVLFSTQDPNLPSKVKFGTHRWIYRTCCYMLNKCKAKELFNLMRNTKFMADDWVYISKNTSINKFYYKDIFSHPIELKASTIESERKFLQQK